MAEKADETKAQTPVTVAEAERYGRLCKVYQMQKPLEQLSQDAKRENKTVEEVLKARNMTDTYDFIESCKPFDLTCDLMDFSELGSGFPLYFQFLQFLGFMLLLFLVIQSPIMHKNMEYKAMNTWRSTLTNEEVIACNTCTGDNKGNVGTGNKIVSQEYGEKCAAHDMEACAAYTTEDTSAEKGLWCCSSWCYVSGKCPLASSSSVVEDLYFSYDACKDNPTSIKKCPWQKNITYNHPGLTEVKTGLIDEGFPLLGGCTPGNAGSPDNGHGIEGGMHGVINFLALFLFCCGLVFQKARIRHTDSVVDVETTQPNDFAILCSGLPASATDETSIADFWKTNAVKDKEVDIVKVVIGWDLEEFNKLIDEVKKLNRTRIKLMTESGMSADHPQVKSIIEQIKEIQKQIVSTGPQVASRMTSTGINIVIFRTQADHRDCLDRWTGFWPKYFNSEKGCFFGLCKGEPLPRWKDGAGREVAALFVKRASNPMDVNWVDLGRTSQQRMTRFLQNTFFMVVLILIAFGCIAGLNMWEEEMRTETVNEDTGETEYKASRALVFLPALLVSFLNMVINMSARKLSEREYHNTKTDQQASTIMKMAMGLIINTAGVTLLWESRDGTKGWYVQGGLVDAVYYMLLVNAMVPSIVSMFDLVGRLNRSIRWSRNMGAKMEAAPRKQGEMYKKMYWEPSEFDTPRHYANALQTFISCALYQPIMPQVMVWGFIGIVLQYWIDKYMLLRVHKRPEALEGSFSAYSSLAFTRMFITIGLPIGILIFLSPSTKSTASVSPYVAFGLVLAVITAIIPDALQRLLLCTGICLGREKFDASSTAADLDYYGAQMFWPPSMKYHKTHPLYKTLPEVINPENLSPGAGMISGQQMRDGAKGYGERAGAATEATAIVQPLVIGKGKIHDFQRGDDVVVAQSSVLLMPSSAGGGYVPGQAPAAGPSAGYVPGPAPSAGPSGYVPGQSVATVQGTIAVQVQGVIAEDGPPVWEFETNHGWKAFDDDCQEYVEKLYQNFSSGGAPTRKVKTRGHEIQIDFKAMEQRAGGSGHERKIRRRT